jgi:hypothetical protein
MQQNVDILDAPFTAGSYQPPRTPGILHAVCDLSEFCFDVLAYNTDKTISHGTKGDIEERENWLTKWRLLEESLPDMFRDEKNLTPQTCFLRFAFFSGRSIYSLTSHRYHQSEAAISILQRLDSNVRFPQSDSSVKELYLEHCSAVCDTIDRYLKQWPAEGLTGRGIYIAVTPLIPLLDDPATHSLFERGCCHLRLCIPNLPIFKLLLQAIQAIAWSMKKEIPPNARYCFEGLGKLDTAKDLPLSFVLPQQKEFLESLERDKDDDEEGDISEELSAILARWSAFLDD